MTTVPSGQRKRSVTQVLASPNGLVADIAALLLIPAYVVVILLLYVNEHDNVTRIFAALSPLVATAVGWVFGREVHRKAGGERDSLRPKRHRGSDERAQIGGRRKDGS